MGGVAECVAKAEASRLSKEQRIILGIALSMMETSGARTNGIVGWAKVGSSRTKQAALSRSLRRLEERGLLRRCNIVEDQRPIRELKRKMWRAMRGLPKEEPTPKRPRKHRTTHVELTELGVAVARLSNLDIEPVIQVIAQGLEARRLSKRRAEIDNLMKHGRLTP